MSTCGQISASVVLDCDNVMVAGANDRLVLINKDDWDLATITPDGENAELITGIDLASGTDAYYFEGKNYSTEPKQTLVKQRYSEVFDHEIIFKVFKSNAATKVQIEALVKGKFVAIIENNFRGADGDSAFEIYGYDVGLQTMELERAIMDADTQGAYNITLRTPDDIKEGHLPKTLFLTSYAITKAIVDALL